MNSLDIIRNIFALIGIIFCISLIGGYLLYRFDRPTTNPEKSQYPDDFYNVR